MKRLFVVNGLFGFLTCLAAKPVAETDSVTVLGLFSADEADNARMESAMRALAPIDSVVFLTDPSTYIRSFEDSGWMAALSQPDEVRMFFTHNTWLHNRVFAAYPDAAVLLYEEGMASYYPGLLGKYRTNGRLQGVYLHNYLDAFVSPDAASKPECFGLLDRPRFSELLARTAKLRPQHVEFGPDCVVVIEQYLHRKGGISSPEGAADEYAAAILAIAERGYRIAYKEHPRERSGFFDLILARVPGWVRDRTFLIERHDVLLEELFVTSRPAAVVAINSTSLLTAPQYFDVPSYRIESLAPFDAALAIDVENEGLASNQIALAARIPTLDELPERDRLSRALPAFLRRVHSVPPMHEDVGQLSLTSSTYTADFTVLLREVANPEVRVVSFDLFDTLVKRPAVQPSDVYALLDECFVGDLPSYVRFSEVRGGAFGRLRAAAKAHGEEQPEYGLTAVYAYIAETLGLSSAAAEAMHAAEVELEAQLVEPRRAGVALVHAARAFGKPWVITTDTFFTADELEAVALGKLPVAPDQLFSSLDLQATKAAGTLLPRVAEELGLDPSAILHIGDRADHDVERARRCGMRAAHLPSHTAGALRHQRLHRLWGGVREERTAALFRGAIWAEVFDNPFRRFDSESVCGGEARLVGYMAISQAMFGWSQWILESASSRGYDLLAFLSRDGFVPLDLCRRLVQLREPGPSLEYVYSSRRAMFTVFNQTRGHIAYTELVHGLSAQTTVHNLLVTRFGSEVAEEFGRRIAAAGPGSPFEPIGREYMNAVKNALGEYAAQISQHTHGANAAAVDYYRRALDGASHPAVVDIGYSGSAQRGITEATSRGLGGLYFTTMEHNWEFARLSGAAVDEYANHPVFFRTGGLVEYLFTPAGLDTCVGFALDGAEAVPRVEPADVVDDPVRGEVHAGLREAFERIFAVFGDRTGQLRFRPRAGWMALAEFLAEPGAGDARCLQGGAHEDAVAGDVFDVFRYWAEGRAVAAQDRPDRPARPAVPESETAPAGGAESVRTIARETKAVAARVRRGVAARVRRSAQRARDRQ